MKRLVCAVLVTLGLLLALPTSSVSALGLKLAPLDYKTTLKAREHQQGFIDISNPSAQTVTVKTGVQAFKQIDNDGGLQFYDDKQVTDGVQLDMSSFDLGPRQALRMMFQIDANKLPTGDVFAAIFFTTEPKEPQSGVGQLVRVGTLLSIINQTPGQRSAEVTHLSIPLVQLSGTIDGSYSIKNTGRQNSGFYPTVSVSSWPGGPTKQVVSSLVFGGRERANDFTYQAGIGIHVVQIAYGNSKKSQVVITLTPWMIVFIAMIILLIAIELILLKRRRSQAHKKTPSTPAK
jgi:hypothetical protein